MPVNGMCKQETKLGIGEDLSSTQRLKKRQRKKEIRGDNILSYAVGGQIRATKKRERKEEEEK